MTKLDPYFYDQIKEILLSARNNVYATANFAMVEAYWLIGKSIVEKQAGEVRAEYGARLLAGLSAKMTVDFGKGFTVANLQNMRLFYLTFPDFNTLCNKLSWSHYRLLMRVEDGRARLFYLDECVKSGWSVRQLERQINTFLFERLLSSRNKSEVSAEIQRTAPVEQPEDIIRDPYVLEFLGLKPFESFFEKDLEQALIDHIQNFLLELGRGFSFVARKKRFTFDRRHFYIDLVFYNYILKCFVLIDFKLGDLTYQDLGQMQMNVNYYTKEMMNDGDNPPIGIVLCANKSDIIVIYTLSESSNKIFDSRYKHYLPTEEEWIKELNREYNVLDNGKITK